MNSLGFCSFFSEMVVLIPSSFIKKGSLAQRETKYYQIALTCKHIRLFAFSVFSLGILLAVNPFRRNPSHKPTITTTTKQNKTKQNKTKKLRKTNKQYRCQRNAQKSGSEVQISRLKEHCFVVSPKEQENLERCLYREARLLFGGRWEWGRGRGREAYKQQFPVFEVGCFIEKIKK